MSRPETVTIVTGGGAGIGRAVARRFARDCGPVIVADIRENLATAVAEEIASSGGVAVARGVDVTQETAVMALVESALERWDRLDVVVNSAGVDSHGPLSDFSADDFDRSVSVNLRSVFLSAKHAAGPMSRSGGGSIVNIASVMARYSAPGYAAYTASKGGVIAMTRNLALELGPSGIRVNAIAPGYIDTALWEEVVRSKAEPEEFAEQIRMLHPVGRRGTPEDVAAAAAFLASGEAAFISGHTLVVDGGMTTRLKAPRG